MPIGFLGQARRVLADRPGLYHAEPNPSTGLVAFEKLEADVPRGLEVRTVASDFDLKAVYPNGAPPGGRVHDPVWGPAGSQLAIALESQSRLRHRNVVEPRLAIIDGRAKQYRRIDDRLSDQTIERWGVIPVFWSQMGIVVKNNLGLFCCDPSGAGCRVVYSPSLQKRVLGARPVEGSKALVLVGDPLSRETLMSWAWAREVHEVDLSTGEGRVLLRIPANVFIADLDWIGGKAVSQ